MSKLGAFLDDVVGALAKAEAKARRPASAKAKVPPARALGLDGSSPFAQPVQAQRRRTQRAVEHLPNPPRLLQVPLRRRYTSAERDFILGEQGRRLYALARATGLSGDELRSALPAADRPQLDLFARLASDHTRKLLAELGDVPRPRAYPARPDGAAERLWHGATVTLPMSLLGHDFQSRFAEIGDAASRSTLLAKPMWDDATSLVVNAVPSLYETGKAGVALAHGDTGPAKRIVGALDDGFVGLMLRGDFEGAARFAGTHPLFAALELSGTAGAVGRGAGATMRAGVLGGRAQRAAAMSRAPLVDAYGRTVSERRHSADVLRKGAVVARERVQRRRGIDPNRTTAARYARSGQPHQSRAAVDEFVAMVEALRRMGRQDALRRARGMRPDRGGGRVARALDRTLPALARPERDVLHAVVEGRVDLRRFGADLRAERNRLDAVYRRERESMDADARAANRQQVRAIDRVLRDPKALRNTRGLAEAAEKYRSSHDEITSRMIELGLLQPEQALIARIRPYAVAKMNGRVDRAGRLVDADGELLSADRVLAHMDEHGIPLPSFVSHRLDSRGARAYYVNFLRRRATVDAHRRTGRATERGAHASDFESLADQHVHAQGLVDAVGAFDAFVHRFGLKQRDGRMFTWDEAQRLAADPTPLAARDSHGNPIPGYADLVPVRVVPARYSESTRSAIEGRQDAHRLPDVDALVEDRLVDAQRAPEGDAARARNVVLVPADELRRFHDHQLTGSTTLAKAGQAVTGTFRSTVLPFSSKWLTGNVAEALLRLGAVSAGFNSHRIGRRLVRELERADADAAREFRARTLGGQFFGGMERTAVRRDASSFRGTRLELPAAVAGVAARAPVVRQGLGALRLFRDGVFAFNKWTEQQAQLAVIGKEARQQMQEMTGSWIKATRAAEPAFLDLVNGLTDTPRQVRFANAIDETLGRYGRFSPSLRKLAQSATPFLPWYLNAARFVMHTLPAKHPVKTALLSRVAETFESDFAAQHDDVPPGDLQAGVVLDDGGILNLARYTPFGAFTNMPEGLADPILPQLSGVLLSLGGRSWTGAELETADGEATRGDRIPIALSAFFESITPGLSIVRRIREGGATPYDDSTVLSPKTKAGTARTGAADRILNPLRPTYLSGAVTPAKLVGAPTGGRAPAAAGRGPAVGRGRAPSSSGRAP